MGKILRVIGKKYFNAFKNESNFSTNLGDYTNNLAGTVMEFVKAEITLEVSWNSASSISNPWAVTSLGGTRYGIQRSTGSFTDDGWSEGNIVDYHVAGAFVVAAVIDFISDDGSYMIIDSSVNIAGTNIDNAAIFPDNTLQENYLNTLVYSPNLIENNDAFTTSSLQNGVTVGYVTTNARSASPVEMTAVGTNKSFVSGQVFINYEATSQPYFQAFKIAHTFIIHPFYFENDDFTTPPSFLDGTSSLKYVFQADFRAVLSDPNTSKVLIFENNLGSVGYFGETQTKAVPSYSIESVTYNNSLNRLLYTEPTIVTIRVNGSFDSNSKYTLFFSYLPTATETSSNGTFNEIYKYNWQSNFPGTSSGYTGTITALSSVIDSGDLVITATLEPIGFLETDSYLLALQIGNTSLISKLSDRAIFVLGTDSFGAIRQNNELITVSNIEFKNHHGETGTAINAYPESDLALSFDFDLDLNKQAVINSLECWLIAYNTVTDTYFKLDSYNFTLNPLFVEGVQQINVNTTRGYFLGNSDFNKVKVTTGANTAGFQKYSVKLGQKVTWQDWIPNPAVDTIFFNNTKPNNNLNFKASNYSNLNNYVIKMLIKSDVTGLDAFGSITLQSYEFFTDSFTIYDYLKDGNITPKIVPIVQTFSSTTMANLNGNISADVDTLFRVVWLLDEPVASALGSTALHRIEQTNQQGTSIFELSSYDSTITVSNNLLKPIDGENFLKMYALGGNIISECLIDYTKLLPNSSYNLSAEITKI